MALVTYLDYNVTLLQIAGQFTLDKSKAMIWRKLHVFIRVSAELFLVFYFVSLSAGIREKGAFQFNLVVLDYVYIGGIIWGLSKTIYYNKYERHCRNLIFKMNSMFKYTTNTSLEEISMKYQLNFTNRLTLSWIITIAVIVTCINLLPFASKARNLPLPIWTSFDWTISPYFELTYIFESIIFWSLFLMVVPTEIFFVCVVLLTTEQFKLLGWEVKNLLYTTLLQNKIPKETILSFIAFIDCNRYARCRDIKNELNFNGIQEVFQSEKFHEDMISNLNQLIKFHQSLLLFCADLDDFFSPIMLMFVPTAVLILIPLSVILMTATDLMPLLPYFPMCTYVYFQIFLSCYFGHFYTSQYEQLQAILYDLPWYNCNKKYNTNMKFFLHKLSMPVTFTVGKFTNLNLSLFLAAIKTVISYCVVLYQLMQH